MAYKISILGTGNVAWHLAKTLDAAGHSIAQVYGRSLKNAQELAHPYKAHAINSLQQLNYDVDVLLLCVADDAIATIAAQLTRSKCLVAHTSGAVDMELLKTTSEYYGVFYPLQTLSAGKPVNFFEVPVCIEGSNKAAEMQLKAVADTISNRVQYINSDKRRYLHLAAVFANNFSNAMYAGAAKILEAQNIDFNLLRPLIKETAEKVQTLSPQAAQTGPAKRHDTITQQKHLELLAAGSDEEKIYRLLTEVIEKEFQKH
jgi:predicted short-subunit dehydrogenase-like oxidoreductase (DUF2520 family)